MTVSCVYTYIYIYIVCSSLVRLLLLARATHLLSGRLLAVSRATYDKTHSAPSSPLTNQPPSHPRFSDIATPTWDRRRRALRPRSCPYITRRPQEVVPHLIGLSYCADARAPLRQYVSDLKLDGQLNSCLIWCVVLNKRTKRNNYRNFVLRSRPFVQLCASLLKHLEQFNSNSI